jgi:pimeloyl-ACP methyl ester carboxylesterase
MQQPYPKRVSVAAGVELNVLLWEPLAATGPSTQDPPVLCVHGLASNARLWESVGGELAHHGHAVAAVDLRGHGLSSKPEEGYDIGTFVGDLVAIIDYLGWEELYAVGQSFGANLVLELAARHLRPLTGVALIDGGTVELSDRFRDWSACEAALAPPAIEGMSMERLASWLRSMYPDWPEEGLAATMANMEVLPDGTVRPWLTRAHHMQLLRALWQHHPFQLYSSLKVPVLLVMADDPGDARFVEAKRQGVVRAESALAKVSTHWIAGDHDLHAQHPLQIAKLIHSAARDR